MQGENRLIIKMMKKYERELNEFLYQHNLKKEYFLAWIPETYSDIEALEKDSFLLCIENDEIVGCIGTYLSLEQKVVRLLGPIIEETYFYKYIDELYHDLLKTIPGDVHEMKIAFFEENNLCRQWCEKEGFEQYNAERTLILQQELFEDNQEAIKTKISPFEDKYKEGLALVHPKGVFFTLEELMEQISFNHHLLLAVENEEVKGYVYYEKAEDNSIGEIVLLHVREDVRGKGYGSLLIKKAIRSLLNEKIKDIVTNVRVDNYGAQKLYKRLGFIDKETIYAYRKYLN